MDGELIAAIATAVVSVGAAAVAYGEARTAKTAAQSAEEQVALMRRQIEGEEEERREARGPQFAVEDVRIRDRRDAGGITLRQVHGPALSSVTATVSGDGVEGLPLAAWFLSEQEGGEIQTERPESIEIGPLAVGATAIVEFEIERRTAPTKILVQLGCHSADGTDWWQRSIAAVIDPLADYRHR
ncbi:hypothetical protein [Streptomyces sp. NBC_01353]|uniref:hypothetical protein n=1 Tax=Streptomyces sp. NBC_01353 TaxID=2903835 RepID=UPI002E316D78|nr:hypothetical protein [Streptomyces sp. NBC_01353]